MMLPLFGVEFTDPYMPWYQKLLIFFVVGAFVCLGMSAGQRSKK